MEIFLSGCLRMRISNLVQLCAPYASLPRSSVGIGSYHFKFKLSLFWISILFQLHTSIAYLSRLGWIWIYQRRFSGNGFGWDYCCVFKIYLVGWHRLIMCLLLLMLHLYIVLFYGFFVLSLVRISWVWSIEGRS